MHHAHGIMVAAFPTCPIRKYRFRSEEVVSCAEYEFVIESAQARESLFHDNRVVRYQTTPRVFLFVLPEAVSGGLLRREQQRCIPSNHDLP